MGHDYCHRHNCLCYRGCPDCTHSPALESIKQQETASVAEQEIKEGQAQRFAQLMVDKGIPLIGEEELRALESMTIEQYQEWLAGLKRVGLPSCE